MSKRRQDVPRRRALQALGVFGLAGCSSRGNSSGAEGPVQGVGSSGAPGPAGLGGSCVLTPKQTAGPFFFDTRLARSDIREGKPGSELQLTLRLLRARDCSPVEGAVVELWHADADGVYSAFNVAQGNRADAAGETFLRGHQQSDGFGRVRFTTIYPGWYPGRTVHLHVMIAIGGDRQLVTQLYFPEDLTQELYSRAPYVARGLPDTTNTMDAVAGGEAENPPLLLSPTSEAEVYSAQRDLSLDLA